MPALTPRPIVRFRRYRSGWPGKSLAALILAGDERVLDVGCGDGRVSAAIAGDAAEYAALAGAAGFVVERADVVHPNDPNDRNHPNVAAGFSPPPLARSGMA